MHRFRTFTSVQPSMYFTIGAQLTTLKLSSGKCCNTSPAVMWGACICTKV